MNKSEGKVKERNVDRAGAFPQQEKEWQPPSLTVWEVVRDTSAEASKTASGADSRGMRVVTPDFD